MSEKVQQKATSFVLKKIKCTPDEKLAVLGIAIGMRNDKTAVVSQDEFAIYIGTTKDEAIKIVTLLIENGIIKLSGRNTYKITGF